MLSQINKPATKQSKLGSMFKSYSRMNNLVNNFSTINKNQMAQFNKIKSWWHPSSQMNVLFQYNYQRIQFLKTILKNEGKQFDFGKSLKNMNVVDVGCGAGFLAESLTRLGAKVTGLDPNNTSYQQAVQHKQNQKSLQSLQYQNCSIQQYLQLNPSKVGIYDLVCSMDVIQHVDNLTEFLKALVASLHPNGLIMLSTISKTFYSFISHIVVAEYITGLVPRGTHNYNKFITPTDLIGVLKSVGVEVIGIRQLEYTWRGDFKQSQGGQNYMVIGRKAIIPQTQIKEQGKLESIQQQSYINTK